MPKNNFCFYKSIVGIILAHIHFLYTLCNYNCFFKFQSCFKEAGNMIVRVRILKNVENRSKMSFGSLICPTVVKWRVKFP